MSAALASLVEELHATAARKLIELLTTQTDPALLARLISTALRFKIAVPKEKQQASKPQAETATPEAATPQPVNRPEAAPAPKPLRPLTQQEFADLVRTHGHRYAEQQRILRLEQLCEHGSQPPAHQHPPAAA